MYTTVHTTADGDAVVGESRRTAAQLRRERAYVEIRRMVLAGDFAFGQRVGEEAVAEAVGVSRTPVREALTRLHGDHLLRRYADGGFYVAEPDILELRDLYELRLTIEVRAIERGAARGVEHDRAALGALRETWTAIQAAPPAPDGSFIDLDEQFHLALCRASGNFALAETLEGVNARIRQVRMYDFLSADRIAISITEHLDIIDAVLAREHEHAAALMRQHIGDSLEVVEERAAAAMARMMRNRSRRRVRT
jgi:DNA-binding GntR family transcriptional regulator